MKTPAIVVRRRILLALAAVGVLAGGAFAAREYAWPAFKAARVDRMNRDAAEFLAADDLANALLVARKSLRSSTANPEAWRVAAAAAIAGGRPDAVWYQENLCREAPTRENRLEFLRLALHHKVPAYALGMIETMAESARADVEYHRLAALICRRSGRAVEAREHLAVLHQLAPDDRVAGFELAAIELAADPQRKDADLRARVLALADDPEIGPRAIALLLRENVTAHEIAGTAYLVRRLRQQPSPDFATRLLIIEGLFLLADPAGAAELALLQASVADQPAEVGAVMVFLVREGQAASVAPWFERLPEKTRSAEVVRRETAEALLVLGDAPGLEALLRGEPWKDREYLRSALLAHAYRAQGRTADFSATWRLALIATGSDRGRMLALLARADGWRWGVERHEVVWKLFGLEPDNTTIQNALVQWERYRGDTTALRRLFARIVEVSPADEPARNNLAYTSLLLDVGAIPAGLMAADLVEKYPKNPYYATTHALALFKRGDAAGALAVLDRLTAAERSEPVRELLRAFCLASLGRVDPAEDLLDGVVLADLLPEERALADDTRLLVAERRREVGNQTRLLALDGGTAEAGAGWLDVVDAKTRGAASTDMRLAESLQVAGDWEGLTSLLGASRWKDGDYLRSALLAQAFRRTDHLRESREAWSQAVALAARDGSRLRNLGALAARWSWTAEQIDTLNRRYESDPGDRETLAELLAHYRALRSTPDLLRVLGLYLAAAPGASDEAVAHAYYSLLLDIHVSRAEVAARTAFEATPSDARRRMVQAFALLKQQRASEALPLLAPPSEAEAQSPELKPIPLLRAAVLARLGESAAARESLANFDLASALPEEVALAELLARQLAAAVAVSG
ncbi:MAG: CDC27 family protein [Burkholderiales bacterium]|nr:CDC27 family protein [Opitutaceae bacterium]